MSVPAVPTDENFALLFCVSRTIDKSAAELLGLEFCRDQCALPHQRDRWCLRPKGPGNRHGEAFFCKICGRFIGYPARS